MKCLNALVFVCLLVCGAILFIGRMFFSNGQFMMLAVFFGWFLVSYSWIAFIIAGAVFLSRHIAASVKFLSKHALSKGNGASFWGTMYSRNFGLSLIATSMLSVDDAQQTPLVMGIVVVVATGVSVVLSRLHALNEKFIAIAFLSFVPTLALTTTIYPIWPYHVMFLGVLLLIGVKPRAASINHDGLFNSSASDTLSCPR